jgi:hypothetical protein
MIARRLLAALGLSIGCSCAAAGPVTEFDLTLNLDAVTNGPSCVSILFPSFGCLAVGQMFTGHFSVDSVILATDGINNTAPVYDFYLPFGVLIYSTGSDNTALAGFRNGQGFGAAPGFVIAGGQVVDLEGGVFGSGDAPFIDMHGFAIPSNRFSANDGVGDLATGSLTVTRHLPEPATLLLVLLALCAAALASRPSKQLGWQRTAAR